MYTDFAYSTKMQFILAVQTFLANTCIMYFISNLILMMANEHASKKQKLIFAFWAGAVIHTGSIYAIYFLGGMISFSPIVYNIVVNHNPVAGLLFCMLGIKVLKLSLIRSIKIMGYFYIYFIFIVNINRVLMTLWPIETTPRYNYFQDFIMQIIYFILLMLIFCFTKYILERKKLIIRLSDKVFIDLKKELIIYILKMIFLFTLTTLLPMLIHNSMLGAVIVILVLAFFFAFNVTFDLFIITKIELENSKVHISALSKGINEFRSVKHDFYNILHTYNGYLEIGDLEGLKKYHKSLTNLTVHAGKTIEISQKIKENPAIVSLLINMAEKAEKAEVEMIVSIQCSLDNLYIDNMDISRCLTCLLDNAIEAAMNSKQKKVFFSIESKVGGSKLIIITNSTDGPVDITVIENAGFTTKQGHSGLGLYNVRSIINKYGNCTFRMIYFNHEVSAYIELKQN